MNQEKIVLSLVNQYDGCDYCPTESHTFPKTEVLVLKCLQSELKLNALFKAVTFSL